MWRFYSQKAVLLQDMLMEGKASLLDCHFLSNKAESRAGGTEVKARNFRWIILLLGSLVQKKTKKLSAAEQQPRFFPFQPYTLRIEWQSLYLPRYLQFKHTGLQRQVLNSTNINSLLCARH